MLLWSQSELRVLQPMRNKMITYVWLVPISIWRLVVFAISLNLVFFWFYYAQKWLFNGDQSYLRPPEIILRSDIDDLFYNTVWNISNGVVT